MSQPEPIPRIPAAVAPIWLIASLFFACGASPHPDRGAAEVTAHALTASAVAEVRLTIQSPSVLSTPLKSLLREKGTWFSALVSNLAVANDYVFTAEAFDGSGGVIAHGMAVGVVISRSKTAKVIIYLNETTERSPFKNSGPLIDAIALSSSSIAPGGLVTLTATAHDPDFGQTVSLAFSWISSGSCGTISEANTTPGTEAAHPSLSTATWTAPQMVGTCTITLTVTDILNLANSGSVEITVTGDAKGVGSASVSVAFNGAPDISGITADPAQISDDGGTSGVVSVLATDPEDDPLVFSWTSPADPACTVEFASPDQATTSFTIGGTAAGATSCTFLVAVSDGVSPGTTFVKNVSTASLTLAIARPLVVRTPPVFGVAYQSAASVTSGDLVTFAAIAFDSAGGKLSFAWSASSGSAPEAADPVALGLDPAFNAGATWTVPDGGENAPGDLVVSVTATSSASSLQSSFSFSLAPAPANPP